MSTPSPILDRWVARPGQGFRLVVRPSTIEAADEIGAYHPDLEDAELKFELKMEEDEGSNGAIAAKITLSDTWPIQLIELVKKIRFYPVPPDKGEFLSARPLDDIKQPHMNGWKIVEWTVHRTKIDGKDVHQDHMVWRKVTEGLGPRKVGSIAHSLYTWLPYRD